MIASEYDELDRELGQISDGHGELPRSGPGMRILPVVIGVVSLLALGSIVWYAYSQGVREGSEVAAPILRPDSPAKVSPEDRGGRAIAGTDLDVYERISGADTQTPGVRVERILPPPEEPTIPAVASGNLDRATTGTAVLDETSRIPTDTAPAQTTTRPTIPDPASGAAPVAQALAAPDDPPPTAGQATQNAAATADQPTADQPTAGAVTPPEVATTPAPAPSEAPRSTLEPQVAPTQATPTQTTPTQTAAAPPAAQTPAAQTPAAQTPAAPTPFAAPADGAGSGWRIQLAALRTDAAARAEWAKRQGAHPDILGGFSLEVQAVTVNGSQFFRVRGGPLASKAEASAVCGRLKALNVACIPVAPGR